MDSSKPARFYKMILSHTPPQRLMIPRKFARNYREDLEDRILLRVPRGVPWLVDLERDEGEIWLQNGWPQFARFHSLSRGHILFFEYQGNCNFKVVIFNKGAAEIEYPLASSTQQETFNVTDESLQAVRGGSGRNDARPCKKTKVNSSCKKACHNGDSSRQNLQETKSTKASSSKRTLYTEEKGPVGLIRASEEDKARALAEAKAFKSQKPSSFILIMYPSYEAGKKLGLSVQAAFLEGYVSREKGDTLIFQMGDKTWHVQCTLFSNRRGTRHSTRCRLGAGWTEFARENSLEAGDVCVFEPVNQSQKLLKVAIFHAAVQNVD